jgi:hypothetical protein
VLTCVKVITGTKCLIRDKKTINLRFGKVGRISMVGRGTRFQEITGEEKRKVRKTLIAKTFLTCNF